MPSHPSAPVVEPFPAALVDRFVPRDEERVVAFLRAGVPLSLLLDLAGSDPHSRELYAAECSG